MIPILYPENQVYFDTNGIGRLSDAIDCTVIEERNGIYELSMRYPVNGLHADEIVNGAIIGATHDDTGDIQPFDIYRITKPLNGVFTINARHIAYRLSQYTLLPMTAGSFAEAFARFPGNIIPGSPFSFWTDKDVTGDFTVKVPSTVRSMLGGTAGSLMDVYGKTEYEWDKWTVKAHLNRGTATGVTIRYGKNLTDMEQVLDEAEAYSGVVPYWIKTAELDEDGEETSSSEVIMLPEKIVYQEEADTVPGILVVNGFPLKINDGVLEIEAGRRIRVMPLDLSDRFENQPTDAQLRQAAQNYLAANQPWDPNRNIKIDFVQLWQTKEYENVAPLLRLRLCDRVNVYNPVLGINQNDIQIVKVTYNVLLDRYDSMELGEPKTNLGATIREAVTASIMQAVPTQTAMQKAIDAATRLITGGLGGHVVIGTTADGQPNEILVMDTDSTETAVNVLRINLSGIGFSTTGYNGPFRSAWTLDGHFVADFVDTGTLNANLLRAGIITSIDGKNWWNLETGELNIIAQSIVVNEQQLTLDNALSSLSTNIGTAQSTANNAVSAAAAAQSTANSAATTAGQANSTAAAANQTAGAANQTAQEALQTAQEAETNARALVINLSRDSFIIPTLPDGSDGDYSGCSTVVMVQWGDLDVTDDAQITINDGAGILGVNDGILNVNGGALQLYTGSLTSSWNEATHTYTVTESRADIAIVTFAITYAGKIVTKQLNVVKALQGLTGATGEPGAEGASGISVISVDVWYYLSNSSTHPEGGSWSTNQPTWTEGKFIWFKTVTAYSNGATTESAAACITGSAGYSGADGIGVASIEEQYYLSTSEEEPTGGSWSESPTWKSGMYLWNRLRITYTDGSVAETNAVLAEAINQANQRALDAQTELQNLEPGGVNLIRVSNTLLFDDYYFVGCIAVNGAVLAVNGGILQTRVAP